MKYTKRILFFSIIILFSFLSCERPSYHFSTTQTFNGGWAETKWMYSFFSDGRYVLKSEGHLAGTPKYGDYFKKDSTIILIPATSYFDNEMLNRLKVINENCIRDYAGYFYCKEWEMLNEMSEKQWKAEELVIEKIERLDLMIEKRSQLMSRDSTKKYILRNEGIVILDEGEYAEYELQGWFEPLRRNQVHLRFYVKFDPIQIYDMDFNLME